jgi:hypothetical protein
LDSKPFAERAAGAGLNAMLNNDVEALPVLFPGLRITSAAFRPDGDLNPLTIPIALPLPDWNHWLPRIHPLDAWGARFDASSFAQMYENYTSTDFKSPIEGAAFFDKWLKARNKMLAPHLTATSTKWTPELAEFFYSAQSWQLVKTWEIVQELNLEGRSWPNTVPAATAPSEMNIPNGPNGMGGSALTSEYFNNSWYELQTLVNSGNHQHHGRQPVDWPYLLGHILELEGLSGIPEPGRLLITLIKAWQSTDPSIGPRNIAEGWRPEQNVDPRIMVAAEWSPMFRSLPLDMRQAITQALLAAWLDKTLHYPIASYFQRGLSASSYALPAGLQDVSGGKAWESVAQFKAAGVDPLLIARLEAWGAAYTTTAQLFHY